MARVSRPWPRPNRCSRQDLSISLRLSVRCFSRRRRAQAPLRAFRPTTVTCTIFRGRREPGSDLRRYPPPQTTPPPSTPPISGNLSPASAPPRCAHLGVHFHVPVNFVEASVGLFCASQSRTFATCFAPASYDGGEARTQPRVETLYLDVLAKRASPRDFGESRGPRTSRWVRRGARP